MWALTRGKQHPRLSVRTSALSGKPLSRRLTDSILRNTKVICPTPKRMITLNRRSNLFLQGVDEEER